MASLADPGLPGKINFPGPVGSKRRRMRSGGNVSTMSNNAPGISQEHAGDVGEGKAKAKCKGSTTIPIFLKKTYKMIETSDPSIASWTEDGEMFVVKDPDVFATQVIPQYFDHNKFSSFARQLNFYGFRKMQSKPIRNSDFDSGTAKHVTFYNENFKRGRCDLLKKIQRSTRGGGNNTNTESAREVQNLRDKVATLERKLSDVTGQMEERVRRLEMDMLSRMEQMMIAMQQQPSFQLQPSTSIGSANVHSQSSQMQIGNGGLQWNQSTASRGNSVSGIQSVSFPPPQQQSVPSMNSMGSTNMAPPTLPPHPKQKQLPISGLPGTLGLAPDRLSSIRGLSTLSRGISGLTRGASVESSASAVLMRNSWEDKFFSMIMLDAEQNAQGGNVDGQAHQQSVGNTNGQAPNTVSDRSNGQAAIRSTDIDADEELSSVSTSDMP